MANSKLKFLDYFFVLRPTLFFPVWTVFLANYHANIYLDNSFTYLSKNSNPFISALLITMLMGSAFIINQIKDVVSDQKNKKLFIIANGYINKKNATIEAVILSIIAFTTAFYIDLKLGLIFLGVFFSTGILYNLKPFVWKDKPILGIFVNFLGGLTVASAGGITAGTNSWKFIVYALPYAFGLVAVYFLTTLPDIEGDAYANKRTFGVKYGFKLSTYMALIFEVITIVFSLLVKDYVLLIPALLSFPLFLITALTQKMTNVLKAVKFTVLLASLAVCVKFPVYFVIIIFTFFFSKWYYRVRFNIEYPKFAG